MMNKRDFLKGSATALVGSGAMTTAVAAVRPSLNRLSGQASWQATSGGRSRWTAMR